MTHRFFSVSPGCWLAGVLCASLAGCSQGPAVLLDTPAGAAPLYIPHNATSGDTIPLPPGTTAALPAPVDTVARSGWYTGTALPLQTYGGLCIRTLTVSDFHVQGNEVRFGRFRGTILPDNRLQMVSGQQWIVGQFDGATFHGHLNIPGALDTPGCSYMLTLRRTGP